AMASSPFSALRAANTSTAAPAAARPRAMPSPIPPLPPVTTATRPERSKGVIADLQIAGIPRLLTAIGPRAAMVSIDEPVERHDERCEPTRPDAAGPRPDARDLGRRGRNRTPAPHPGAAARTTAR